MESQPRIREAVANDFDVVQDLMNDALEPYYGGDHAAHARRIFYTHLSGGSDAIGFFSFEQKMFVLCVRNKLVGMIHLVGKRQGTYKISPLIVAPNFQGKLGYGSLLLAQAEKYARANLARQLYCTVAEENKSALQFFLRKNFTIAGQSYSHYKIGITETMLYKPLDDEARQQDFDRPHISVLPACQEHYAQIRQLLLSALPQNFRDIDDGWVTSLFQGYDRRHTGDPNQKYKLLYVAIDRSGSILGVAGATPKKGLPIKVMPFLASSMPAFEALLVDTPFLLKKFGHKLYIHIVPTVEETMTLQHQGWKLDAALPGAYHDDRVTQQWSLEIGEEITMRTMRVKQTFFDLIASGKKTLEVRVGYENIKSIQPGERIRLASHTNQQTIRIKDIRHYNSFDNMLEAEVADLIVPGTTKESLRVLLKDIYPPDRERLGVIVLEIGVENRPERSIDSTSR
jgi:ASC-1-like (ASCH) protein/ribosomal protein S18 acetylase RimI-like enzyme